jgi:diguanylate cyclase (GGDEF)-like protein
LEPGPINRELYNVATASMTAALKQIRAHGSAPDRDLIDRILVQHTSYLRSTARLFEAVDRHETAVVLQIDRTETDPAFSVIQRAVFDKAAAQHDTSLDRLADLNRLERLTSRMTPAVFVLGSLAVALLALSSRGYLRILITERAQAVHASLHDRLTGLPNRALLTDRLAQSLRAGARTAHTTGLLRIDLDRFREINDTFGHEYGDELLTQVGPRLNAVLRASDSVAGFGGDEFAVLLPEVADLAATLAIAAKLRHAFQTPFEVDGVELDVEASVGAVVSGEHGDDAATLLRHADIAMHTAKSQNLGIVAYDPGADGHNPARLSLLGDLRRALERDELILHYQPKVSVSTGEVVGAEALVRWLHPTRGLLFPDSFIPMAEQTGLIGSLTHRVLEIAVIQARTWAEAGRAIQVAVNLSARNLLDEQLPEQVGALLAVHALPASLLELEVTESAIMSDPVLAGRLLQRLADLGVRLSIDDFGAGYTSLGQLKTLPVSELKIDRSFVMSMNDDASDALIVHSVVDLGHNLGLTIVAEGVETAEALSALKEFRCDIAQGYYIARPMAIDNFDLWCLDRPIAPPPQAHLSRSPGTGNHAGEGQSSGNACV